MFFFSFERESLVPVWNKHAIDWSKQLCVCISYTNLIQFFFFRPYTASVTVTVYTHSSNIWWKCSYRNWSNINIFYQVIIFTNRSPTTTMSSLWEKAFNNGPSKIFMAFFQTFYLIVCLPLKLHLKTFGVFSLLFLPSLALYIIGKFRSSKRELRCQYYRCFSVNL